MIIALQNINPIIISFGPFSITWYSLSYVVGILLGWVLASKIVQKYSLDISKKHLEDFVTWAIIGIVVGGRIGYILFYDPIKYILNPLDILKTYEGGMSFHGGITGLCLVAYFFSRKYKIKFLTLMDILATVAPLGLFLGRLANFINGELYGRVTNLPWGVIFPGSDMRIRHPSQLYEAVFEGVVLFVILIYIVFRCNSLKSPSLTSGIFLIIYSIFRIIIETFREPDIHIGFLFENLTMGQLLSLPMLILGTYLIIKIRCQSSIPK